MQLVLAAGDVIEVTKQTPSGWWQGTCNGSRFSVARKCRTFSFSDAPPPCSGWFPSNYTEELSHPPLPPLPPTPDDAPAPAAAAAAADADTAASLSAQLIARKQSKRGSAVSADAAAAAAEVGVASAEPSSLPQSGGGVAGDV